MSTTKGLRKAAVGHATAGVSSTWETLKGKGKLGVMDVQVCHTFRLFHNGKSSDLKGLKLSSLLVEFSCGLMCVDPLIFIFFFFPSCASIL